MMKHNLAEKVRYVKCIENLKSNMDKIQVNYVPVFNKDILQLLELTHKRTKASAIYFAIEYTIKKLKEEEVLNNNLKKEEKEKQKGIENNE